MKQAKSHKNSTEWKFLSQFTELSDNVDFDLEEWLADLLVDQWMNQQSNNADIEGQKLFCHGRKDIT